MWPPQGKSSEILARSRHRETIAECDLDNARVVCALVISDQIDKLGIVTDPSFAFRARSIGLVRLPRRFVSDPCRASIRNPCFAPSDRRPPAFRQARQADRRGPLSLGLAVLDLERVAIARFHHQARHRDRMAA